MNTIKILFLIFAVSFLIACGEGGMGGTGFDEEQQVLSHGVVTVTAENEIAVQGRRFKTDNANIQINDETQTGMDLKTGMIATVEGTNNIREDISQASYIEINNTISGPISELLSNNRIVVLGQIIQLDDDTNYNDPNAQALLSVGTQISVMGFVSSDGEIRATFVNHEENDTTQVLSGYVESLDKDNQIFLLGDLQIDYSSGEISDEVLVRIVDGVFVEVEGSFDIETNLFSAHEIEFSGFEVLSEDRDSDVELEGLVAKMLDNNEFVLLGTIVRITDTTQFKSGSVEDIRVNTKVHVRGHINDTVLEASEIEIELPSESSNQAQNQSSNQLDGTNTISLSGSVTSVVTSVSVNSLSVAGMSATEFVVSDSTSFVGISSLDDIGVDNTVEVTAQMDANQVTATQIRLVESSAKEDILIEAAVEKIVSPKIWIFGSIVDLSQTAVNGGNLDNFLISLDANLETRKISLQGKLVDSVVQWKEADYLGN